MTTSIHARINLGLDFIVRNMKNGGVPSASLGDAAGNWSTAESLEAILTAAPLIPDRRAICLEMADYLLRHQGVDGSWSLVEDGISACSMATAQSIIALHKTRKIADATLASRIDTAIANALSWLKSSQNSSGGWAVEPYHEYPESDVREYPTYMAIRALGELGEVAENSQSVRLAVNYLWSLYDGHGGFSSAEGLKSDPCSTVRAYTSISTAGCAGETVDLMGRVTKYIFSSRPQSGLWPLRSEKYPRGVSGSVEYNHNTLAHLLQFFTRVRPDTCDQAQLADWFVNHQNDDGSWCLGGDERSFPNIVTWPTSEAILALIHYERSLSVQQFETETPQQVVGIHKVSNRTRFAVSILLAVVLVQFLMLIGAWDGVRESWLRLPTEFRQSFSWTLAIGITINSLTGLVGFILGRALRKRGSNVVRRS